MSDYWKFDRGSEWRKWDLHIHTPISICQQYGGNEKFDKFILALERLPVDVKVIGITDYYFIDGYEKVMEYKNKGRLENIDKIFPVLEFRIDTFGSGNENKLQKINLNILFDIDENNLAKEVGKIRTEFISQIPITKLEKHKTKMLSIENLTQEAGGDLKKGFSNFVPSTDKVFELINSSTWKDKTFLFLGYKEWSNLDKNQQLKSFKEDLYNRASAFLSANPSTIEQSQEWLDSFGKKRLLHSGDIHDFSILDTAEQNDDGTFKNSENYICYTWIKADPTFNGLKQIIYEPVERVKIQGNRPEEKRGYYLIDKVNLNEEKFWNETIKLNPNLNTIIGGRSTGKSTLLKCIASVINKTLNDNGDNEIFISKHLSGVSIDWKDGAKSENREIQFFPQNYMYEIAKDTEKTDKLIRDIILNKDEKKILMNYESFCATNRTEIINSVNNVYKIQTDIFNKNVELKNNGDKNGILKEISTIENTIKELNIGSQITEIELRNYEEISKVIIQKQTLTKQLETDIDKINELEEKAVYNKAMEYELNVLSEETRLKILNVFISMSDKFQKQWVESLTEEIRLLKSGLIQLGKEVDELLNNSDYQNGLEHLKANKQYQELQIRLNGERIKLSIILEIEKDISILVAQRDSLVSNILNNHKEYYRKAEELIKALTLVHEGIKIAAKVNYLEEELQQFLTTRLNQKGYDRQKYITDYIKKYPKEMYNITLDYFTKSLNNEIDYKSGYITNNVTSELLSTNWYSISYDLIYQNDSFKDMSQGKQAFVILKLLLEFSDKRCPIIIDQPEDSLDNRAIYTELVQYLKAKKKERQIILVTHNPNIVVSSDTEQIIVANQNGKDSKNRDSLKFSYVAAGLEYSKNKDDSIKTILESQGIKEHVCEILEGGTDAFKNREEKYNL